MITARTVPAATCATCQHYSRPGMWSARCRLGPPSWMNNPAHITDTHPDYAEACRVRAGNSCERYAAAVAMEKAA